jgi:hypothetical protein
MVKNRQKGITKATGTTKRTSTLGYGTLSTYPPPKIEGNFGIRREPAVIHCRPPVVPFDGGFPRASANISYSANGLFFALYLICHIFALFLYLHIHHTPHTKGLILFARDRGEGIF